MLPEGTKTDNVAIPNAEGFVGRENKFVGLKNEYVEQPVAKPNATFSQLDEERSRSIRNTVFAAAEEIKAKTSKEVPQPDERIVEVRVQALRSTMGIIDHYFLVLEGMEYHPGHYKRGNLLPLGTTENFHVVARRRLCIDCYNKIIADFNLREDKRIGSFYPFLNCESLATGFSLQSLGFIALPFVFGFLLLGKLLLALVTFLVALLYLLLVGKYTISRTVRTRCHHLAARSTSCST